MFKPTETKMDDFVPLHEKTQINDPWALQKRFKMTEPFHQLME